MNNIYEGMVFILIAIGIVAVIKICYLIHKKHHGEMGTDPSSDTTMVRRQQNVAGGLIELGPVNYYANDRHNRKDKWFQFKYKKVGNEWLTYILRMPSLNGRDGNLHITHRYRNGNTYWICYDPQPTTLRDAQIISRAWADRELEYISTGTHFENQRW